MYKKMRYYLFPLVLCFQLLKAGPTCADHKTELLLKLLDGGENERTLKVSRSDPLYPPAVVIQVLLDSREKKPSAIIGRLEEFLHNNRF